MGVEEHLIENVLGRSIIEILTVLPPRLTQRQDISAPLVRRLIQGHLAYELICTPTQERNRSSVSMLGVEENLIWKVIIGGIKKHTRKLAERHATTCGIMKVWIPGGCQCQWGQVPSL